MEEKAERQSGIIKVLPREGGRPEDLSREDMNSDTLEGVLDIDPRLWLALGVLPF